MANQNHVTRVQNGPQAWNQWRKRNPNDRPDLSDVSLERIDLMRANLAETDLVRVNLAGANALEARFNGADLVRANLTGTTLVKANLAGANLFEANLSDADLVRADLRGATLVRANLAGANLIGANLEGANLLGAILVGADLVRANLAGANLDRADLTGAHFDGCNLVETYMGEVNGRGLLQNASKQDTAVQVSITQDSGSRQGGSIADVEPDEAHFSSFNLLETRNDHASLAGPRSDKTDGGRISPEDAKQNEVKSSKVVAPKRKRE